jgi:hypothetical protein
MPLDPEEVFPDPLAGAAPAAPLIKNARSDGKTTDRAPSDLSQVPGKSSGPSSAASDGTGLLEGRSGPGELKNSATTPDTRPGTTDARRDARTAATQAAPAETKPEISISEAGVSSAYATLEAAVAAAKEGSIIELNFNGPRAVPEKPLRVSGKRITVRGGKGFRPVVVFAARDLPATGIEGRMMTLNGGNLELVDVDINASVPESGSSDRWALFSLGAADRLKLKGVGITVANPGNRTADVIDVSSDRDAVVPGMGTRPAGPMGSPEFEVEVERSIVRGACTLFSLRTTESGRVSVNQSVVAVQGPFLANWGDDDSPGETKRLSLRLEHVSCFLGGGFVQMDGGDVPRFLLPLAVSARNNIFAARSSTPLFVLAGRTSDEDFRRLVRWEGSHNFYDRFAAYWTVASSGARGSSMPLQFEDWKRLLGDTEIDANNSGIVWKQSWQTKSPAALDNSDFELASVNQAISGATDNTDVGADLSQLRPLPPLSNDE